VTTKNLAGYLAYDKVVAVGCTWIAPIDLIAGEEYDRIRDLAHEAVEIASAYVRQ
jgi:2-keto-3-deoxy-6-phosphogluconate aldolase